MIINELIRYIYHFRKTGFNGLVHYIKLSNFERKIFSNKSVKWNDLGYWEMHPMPSIMQLEKFYSEIYWLNNKYYKEHLLIARDLEHFNFLENKISDKMHSGSVFMNYGAGHGGISYLAAARNLQVINIEPSGVFSGALNNFKNFLNLEEYINSKNNFKKIDIVYSSHTLEHLTDPILFFKDILRLIDKDGKVVIEVPNCRRSNPGDSYFEGGCDGKTSGSHTLYFTKDFFNKMNAKTYFFSGDYDSGEYFEVMHEDDAECMRVIVNAENIVNWISTI
jgi:SAM-dependent methyltransferase